MPLRRNNAPNSPSLVQASASSKICFFSLAVNRRRFALAVTSVSCGTTSAGSIIVPRPSHRWPHRFHRFPVSAPRPPHLRPYDYDDDMIERPSATTSPTTPSPCSVNSHRVTVSLTLAERAVPLSLGLAQSVDPCELLATPPQRIGCRA